MLSGGSAERNISYPVVVEIAWLLLIAAFAGASAYPLYGIIANEFLVVNITLASLFAFYFRFTLFFSQIAYLKYLAAQITLFVFNPLLFIKTLNKMQEIFYLLDTNDLSYFTSAVAKASIYAMNDAVHLFKKEFILFSVGLLILMVAVELRILLAFVKRIREME